MNPLTLVLILLVPATLKADNLETFDYWANYGSRTPPQEQPRVDVYTNPYGTPYGTVTTPGYRYGGGYQQPQQQQFNCVTLYGVTTCNWSWKASTSIWPFW